MILLRNEFQIKYGKIKEAVAIWKEIILFFNQLDAPKITLLTDITGNAYTMILEFEMKDMLEMGTKNFEWGKHANIAELYQKFVLLCDSSKATIYEIQM